MRTAGIVLVLLTLAPPAMARRLPRHRPADFSVSYSSSGGIRGVIERATIAAEGSDEKQQGPAAPETTTFTMSAAELDALYVKLRKAGADHVRSRNERIADRGGMSITITAGGHDWLLDDQGESVVVAKDEARFEKIVAAITDVIAAKVQVRSTR